MNNNPFQIRQPHIIGNPKLRTPQREVYAELKQFSSQSDGQEREIGIVMPVGCGKSVCITLAPFAFNAARALVVAPTVTIAQQLHEDFDPANPAMFYEKCAVLCGQPYPEPVEIRGTTTNIADLELGEGFDHPFLAVAAVFSIFSNLSPFVQFVGRIMRVIEHDAPGHPINQGVVVFHAGANVARRWEDFQQFSEADQEYFEQLLPMEELDFSTADKLTMEPVPSPLSRDDVHRILCS